MKNIKKIFLNEISARKTRNLSKQAFNKYIESSKSYQLYQLDLVTLCDYFLDIKNSIELSWPFSKFTSSGLAKDNKQHQIFNGFKL